MCVCVGGGVDHLLFLSLESLYYEIAGKRLLIAGFQFNG